MKQFTTRLALFCLWTAVIIAALSVVSHAILSIVWIFGICIGLYLIWKVNHKDAVSPNKDN